MEKMRILIISQWCYPEPDLKCLTFAKELVKNGYNVQILTGFPNYPGGRIYNGYKVKLYQKEIINEISIIRVPLFPDHSKSGPKRILNYLSFALAAGIIGTILIKKPDILYVYHPPPTVSIPAIIIKLVYKAPIVYDMQDLWPESLIHADSVSKNKLIIKIATLYLNRMYNWVDKIVVLSNGFKEVLFMRGVSLDKIEVIYNWAYDTMPIADSNIHPSHDYIFKSNCFNIVFAGNIGEGQGLESILEAAEICSQRNLSVRFIFIGDGIKKNDIVYLATTKKIQNVFFIPRQPLNEIDNYLLRADALIVHLKKLEYFKYTIPSKIQSYLKIGKPLILGVEGDAARVVNEANCGIVFEPGNPMSLYKSIEYILNLDKEKLFALGENGRNYYNENFHIKIGTAKFIKIFKALLKYHE
jgi:colanic acid biosynthesis glycosyl transferase WcaI